MPLPLRADTGLRYPSFIFELIFKVTICDLKYQFKFVDYRFTLISSTSKIRVSFGSIDAPAPFSP